MVSARNTANPAEFLIDKFRLLSGISTPQQHGNALMWKTLIGYSETMRPLADQI